MKKPIVLTILDGYGLAEKSPNNAIFSAKTPVLDDIFARFPSTSLACSGKAVGLPTGQMGNSEVGHLNIGAGRVVYQELTRISHDIETGAFAENGVLKAAARGRVHLMGLLSDGGVHSHLDHLFALIDLCNKQGAETYLHCFLDGRDTPPESGMKFLRKTVEKCLDTTAKIATVCGRYYAMDRDNRWERVEKAYNAIALGQGDFSPDCVCTLAQSYKDNVTDEFVQPYICCDNSEIRPSDSVIFFNFRPDRARELTRTLVDPDFTGFERTLIAPRFTCFTRYDAAMPNVQVAFPPQSLDMLLGQVLEKNKKTQLRIAETEKYAHVTFFFNGGNEEKEALEDRILVPSPKVATYDLQPEMSAPQVAAKCAIAIESGKYDVVILNFANCDMVGHTGVFSAAVKSAEAVDAAVKSVFDACHKMDGTMIITADHGNAEQMSAPDGEPFTAHTINPVPFILCKEDAALKPGALCDIAPTILTLLGIEIPKEMTGTSLIIN